jgi:phosphoribosylformylglycinamidine (FGAM) synthase-like enzyme
LDPYLMAQVSLDEAIRNLICVGTDPSTISVLDNFCWPDPVVSKRNPDGKKYLGMLVRACQGLYDAAIFMGTPLISGKDSMKNDFDDGVIRLSVPPTLLVSAMGKVADIQHCLTSDFKNAGDEIFLCSAGTLGLAGSTVAQITGDSHDLCTLNLEKALALYKKLHQAISKEWLSSAHDISDGGLAVCIAESIIGSGLGANIKVKGSTSTLFAEGPAHIVVSLPAKHKDHFLECLQGCNVTHIGTVVSDSRLTLVDENDKTIEWSINDLRTAWNEPLPFA